MLLLDPAFVASYASQTPPWGFNGLGEVIYLRTYSRPVSEPLRDYIDDPEWLDLEDHSQRRSEKWHETITRAINGAQSIGADYTKEEMESLFDHIFHLRASFSGRGLWQLGTPLVERLGGPSLINCFYTAIERIEDFEFLMDMLMVGGGVGFGVERSSIHELPKVRENVRITHEATKDADIIVPDKREGWSRLLHSVLKSYLYTGRSFTYSTMLIRGYGQPLKTFGGTASGPQALIDGVADICKILDSRAGKKLRSVDVLDICNIIGRVVVAGSSRRSAEIALGDPDDYLFLGAKDWSSGAIPGWRQNSNNSIILDDWNHVVPRVWRGYEGNGEPYGFINRELMRRTGRLGEAKNQPKVMGVNPCVVGDTLVAVADGRGLVRIEDLAKSDEDVPVYTFDGGTGLPTVRMMRRPHKTGEQVPVVRVVLDNGESITCTPNHKFIDRSGSRIEAKDLVPGTGLRLLTRYQSSFNPSDPERALRQPYWYVTSGQQTNRGEHRMISEFLLGRKLDREEVVHHENGIGIDNSSNNLTVMFKSDHDEMHSSRMLGDNNPMRRGFTSGAFGDGWSDSYRLKMSETVSGDRNPNFSGVSHDEIRKGAVALTKNLGRRASHSEWEEYSKSSGLPLSFSGWRRLNFGTIGDLLQWAAAQCGFESVHGHTSLALKRALESGYDAEIVEGAVRFNQVCEICKEKFLADQRQIRICSRTCQSKMLSRDEYRNKARVSLERTNEIKRTNLKDRQARIWSDLAFGLGRRPLKSEWKESCIRSGVSSEISRRSSPFRSYDELCDAGSNVNHKVVRVEDAGLADVFNGAVDEFHSYFVGGWESETSSGRPKQHFVLTAQCGEIPLEDGECCNLATIFLPNVESYEQFVEISRLLYKTQKAITTLWFPYEKTRTVVAKNARLGQNPTGILQASGEQLGWLDKGYRELVKFDKAYSKERGLNPSIAVSTVQPGGTLPLLAGVTAGMSPAEGRYFIRRVRFGSNDPLVSALRDRGHKVQYDIDIDGSINHTRFVVDFPCESPKSAIVAEELSAVDHLEWQKRIQTIWADNAVSITVRYRPEELPAIKEWLAQNYNDSVKSVSFLLLDDHNFELAPLERISEWEYNEAIAKLDLSVPLPGGGDPIALECSAGGACPIR